MEHAMDGLSDPLAESSAIPLDLAPLLSRYRQHRNLRIRIERLPRGSRLSRGSNNGDGTWSLTLDDTAGLFYMPPVEVDEAHAIAVRITSVEGGFATTVAQHELVVSPDDAVVVSTSELAAGPAPASPAEGGGEMRRLLDEFADVKAALAARETQLADTRQQIEQARAERSRQVVEAELAAARSAWETELQERLDVAAAEAAAELERSRTAWQADEATRLAEKEEQWRAGSDQALAEAKDALAAREAELREARKSVELAKRTAENELSAARSSWTAEVEKRLESAAADAAANLERSRAAWDAELKDRLAKAEEHAKKREAEAEERSKTRVAEAHERARADQAAKLADAETLWRAQSDRELGVVKTALAARETELAEARADSDRARKAADENLRAARSAWDAELKKRLDGAAADAAAKLEKTRAAWEAEQEKRRAQSVEHAPASADEIRRRFEADHAAELVAAEARREEADRALEDVRSTLGMRESELTGLRAELDQARQASAAEATALRSAWEAELTKRLADASAEADANLAKVRDAWQAEHRAHLAELEDQTAQAREHSLAERAEELAAAEARWREQSDRAVAELKAAVDARESELRNLRTQAGQAQDEETRRRIEAEVAAARTTWDAELQGRLEETVAEGETKLEEARAAWKAEWGERLAEQQRQWQERLDQTRRALRQEAETALAKAKERWQAEEAAKLARAEAQWREQSDRALAEAKAQVRRTEQALAETREDAEPASESHENADLRSLSEELASMKASLAARDSELAQARSELDIERDLWVEETKAVLDKAQQAWQVEEVHRLLAAREQWKKVGPTVQARSAVTEVAKGLRQTQILQRHVLRGLLAASLIAAVAAFPLIGRPLVGSWWPALVSLASSFEPGPDETDTSSVPPPSTAARPARPDATIAVPVATIRTEPSTSSAVVAALNHGDGVEVLERRNGWARVRTITNGNGRPQEGWIFHSLLRDRTSR